MIARTHFFQPTCSSKNEIFDLITLNRTMSASHISGRELAQNMIILSGRFKIAVIKISLLPRWCNCMCVCCSCHVFISSSSHHNCPHVLCKTGHSLTSNPFFSPLQWQQNLFWLGAQSLIFDNSKRTKFLLKVLTTF